jgi:predicted acyl esterase
VADGRNGWSGSERDLSARLSRRGDTVQPETARSAIPDMTVIAFSGMDERAEVSSSNFPRFDRNLNTGGNNYDETRGLVAHDPIHHSQQYPSSLTLSIVRSQVSP